MLRQELRAFSKKFREGIAPDHKCASSPMHCCRRAISSCRRITLPERLTRTGLAVRILFFFREEVPTWTGMRMLVRLSSVYCCFCSREPYHDNGWRRLQSRLHRPQITGIAGCCACAATGHDAARTRAFSIDYLISDGEQLWRKLDAKRTGGLEIDDKLIFCRLLHRQLGRLLAFENPPGVDAALYASRSLLP
jgi:hypothetical protein